MTNGFSRQASFGRKARSYEAHASVQRQAADWLADWLPDPGQYASCLEFGAGTGLFTRHLEPRFELVEATDAEATMVDECRGRIPGVRHRVRDAWAPPPDRNQWEVITSSSLLQWADRPVEALQGWRGILAPGGRILMGLFAAPSLPEMADLLPGGGPVAWRTPAEWSDLVAEAGLHLLKIESDTRRYSYLSARDLWKSLHGTGAVVSRKIPPGRMLRMFKAYEAMFRDQGGIYATWTHCRILAE